MDLNNKTFACGSNITIRPFWYLVCGVPCYTPFSGIDSSLARLTVPNLDKQDKEGFNILWGLACWIIRLQTYWEFNNLWCLARVRLSGYKHPRLGALNCTVLFTTLNPHWFTLQLLCSVQYTIIIQCTVYNYHTVYSIQLLYSVQYVISLQSSVYTYCTVYSIQLYFTVQCTL